MPMPMLSHGYRLSDQSCMVHISFGKFWFKLPRLRD
jgi:hypothetical protein